MVEAHGYSFANYLAHHFILKCLSTLVHCISAKVAVQYLLCCV